MLKTLLGIKNSKSPKKPKKELQKKTVSTKRFNEMIIYYTRELKSRLAEIQKLKKENELLIRTSIRNTARTNELQEENTKLSAASRSSRN